MTPARSPRILVVDDDVLTAMNLESNLRDLGYEVAGPAASATQAMDIVHRDLPDLVLMDIQLSGNFEGIRAASDIRRQCGIPVIFVTGYVSQDLINRAMNTRAHGYLTKPVRTAELHATISLTLAQKRRDSERNQHGEGGAQNALTPITIAPPPSTLTGQQMAVLKLIAQSFSTKKIASTLGITYKTAVSYRTRLMEHLDIHDVAGLTRYAVFHGLVTY
ncbi:MAG TPA: response regulator transcription factor [Bryobacteraceae bacterium]